MTFPPTGGHLHGQPRRKYLGHEPGHGGLLLLLIGGDDAGSVADWRRWCWVCCWLDVGSLIQRAGEARVCVPRCTVHLYFFNHLCFVIGSLAEIFVFDYKWCLNFRLNLLLIDLSFFSNNLLVISNNLLFTKYVITVFPNPVLRVQQTVPCFFAPYWQLGGSKNVDRPQAPGDQVDCVVHIGRGTIL